MKRQLGFFDFIDSLINRVINLFNSVFTSVLKRLINPTAGEVIGALTGAFISAGFKRVSFFSAVSMGMRMGRGIQNFIVNCQPLKNGVDIKCLI